MAFMNTVESSGVFTTTECAERDQLSKTVGWDTDYCQLGKGGYFARVHYCTHPGIRVTHQFSNRETSIRGVPPANHLAILLPVKFSGKCIFQGRPITKNEALIMSPDSEATLRIPRDFEMVTVSLGMARLQESFRAVTDREIGKFIRGTGEILLTARLREHLVQLGLRMIKLGQRQPHSAAWRTAIKEAEDRFVNALSLGLTRGNHPEPGRLARRNRMAYLSRAREYIDANLGSPLGMETLSREIGVSSRTLGYVFRDTLNTTPLHYIKTRRLLAVRQRLLSPDSEKSTVTQAANEYGFAHLGYFSRDYRAQFGELPSQTLLASHWNIKE